ncbi:hypothetical protein BH23ACT5_BH23ACT5_14000 [soil metagenome]
MVVSVVVLFTRWWATGRPRVMVGSGVEPGVYLLTSEECDACAAAREVLRKRGISFVELTWQGDPEMFERLAIESVPSLLSVDQAGSGRWWPGPGPRRGPRGKMPGLNRPGG